MTVDLLCEREAIDSGIIMSETTTANGVLAATALFMASSAPLALSATTGAMPQRVKQFLEDQPVRRVIVDRQDGSPDRSGCSLSFPGGVAALEAKGRREIKGTTLAWRALEPDAPSHELDQTFGDRQP